MAKIAGQIAAFALEHGAKVAVFEHLKHFRPKAKGKSNLRQRFHGWLHRALANKVVADMAEEKQIRVEFVASAYTSSYAFDGTGVITRDPNNRTQAAQPRVPVTLSSLWALQSRAGGP